MAKKKTPKSEEKQINKTPIEEEQVFDVVEMDDEAFDDDWDEEADLDDGWDAAPKRTAKSKPSPLETEGVVYEVADHAEEPEEVEQDIEEDFGDEQNEPVEVYDVPEGPAEVYDVEEPDEIDVAPVEEVARPEQEQADEPVEEVPAEATPVEDVAEPIAEEQTEEAPQETDSVEKSEPEDVEDVDVVEPTADGESEPTEDGEDVELPPEEEAKSEEEIDKEEAALEEYRSMMGDSNAEMADISEYRNYRRKTKTEPKASKPKKSDFDLFANRYKVKTMNATVAATDPIIYFYNACLRYNGSIMLFNVYQVLQDRFLGKMVPQLFTAVAESGTKIEELNEANMLAQLDVCAEFPQYEFIISISTHCFVKPALLERMLKIIPEGGVPNLVLAFDCSALQNIAQAAKTGLGTIRARGLKVLLDNTERVSMDVLSELDYDYIRIDARYYEMDNPRAEAYLRLLLSLAKEQGIGTVACFCDTEDIADYMLFMGVDAVQGNAISRPMRTVPNAVKAITLLPSMLEAPDEETPPADGQ